uniref:RING-type domain-containing protein n=1 Tax=Alexandrium monilatum TaxID=311494 RepID=A0A7S4RLR2_9DINO
MMPSRQRLDQDQAWQPAVIRREVDGPARDQEERTTCCSRACGGPRRVLWPYLLLILVETGAFVALLVEKWPHVRFWHAVFVLALVMQSFLTVLLVQESLLQQPMAGTEDERVLRARESRLKLWYMVHGGACLPLAAALCGSGLELLSAVWGEDPEGFGHGATMLGLAAYHAALLRAAVHLSRQMGCYMRDLRLKPTVLRACRFETVPRAARGRCESCAICLEDFEGGDAVLPLPCGHVFHTRCIALWLSRSRSCPLRCRDALVQPASA